MITVRVLNKDPLEDIVQMMSSSRGKDIVPSIDTSIEDGVLAWWKRRIFEEHSILRSITFMIEDDNIRGDVCNQIVRHTKSLPTYSVQSCRPDRTHVERLPSDKEFKRVTMVFNLIGWIELCKQRLCFQAMKESRDWVVNVVQTMRNRGDKVLQALAFCSVPYCIYRDGCPFQRTCHWYEHMDYPREIEKRYGQYQNYLIGETR